MEAEAPMCSIACVNCGNRSQLFEANFSRFHKICATCRGQSAPYVVCRHCTVSIKIYNQMILLENNEYFDVSHINNSPQGKVQDSPTPLAHPLINSSQASSKLENLCDSCQQGESIFSKCKTKTCMNCYFTMERHRDCKICLACCYCGNVNDVKSIFKCSHLYCGFCESRFSKCNYCDIDPSTHMCKVCNFSYIKKSGDYYKCENCETVFYYNNFSRPVRLNISIGDFKPGK